MPKLPLQVGDVDLANLRASGLRDSTIAANKLRTERGSLVFPYRDLDGTVNCFARYRPHKPKVVDGKAIKYTQPKGSPPRAYFPAASVATLKKGSSPIFVTEGEKKALALSQLQLPAIGVGGIYCWKKKGTDELIADLAAIKWSKRIVYIVFDYDEKPRTRLQVDGARQRLAKALRKAGAEDVFNVELPPGPDGAKQGVDDFLVAQGDEAFQELIAAAIPVPSANAPALSRAEGRTDAANAARLVDRFGDDIRWVGPWDKFLYWDGKRWMVDDELQIHARAKSVATGLWDELKAGIPHLDKETVKIMYDFCRKSNNASGITAMVSVVRSEPGVPIRVPELDSDPWLLNVENGTIDLRTGRIREHQRDDFITKLAPVTFDPDADCPVWKEFLSTIFAGNEELTSYVQRLVGFSLTGVQEEHVLTFLHGTGANGKSTFCEANMKLFGPDYSMKAPPDLLMAKRGESHPTERADLWSKRFVACIETEAGRRMAEALVKELTGGDRQRARRMREDFWEFEPTHHIWLSSNYKPVVVGTDHGIWRRIKLIPFNVKIPDAKQDRQLKHKLVAELSGILNWAITGCLDWQANGLREPEVVSGETKNYRKEMDVIGEFIEKYCELGAAFIAPASRLHEAFKEAFGIAMTQASFGRELEKRGFGSELITSGPHKARMGRRGLRLIEDAAVDEQALRIAAGIKARKAAANVQS